MWGALPFGEGVDSGWWRGIEPLAIVLALAAWQRQEKATRSNRRPGASFHVQSLHFLVYRCTVEYSDFDA
jgi:hypothetical protein